MIKSDCSKKDFISFIEGMPEDDFARFLYFQEMAGTYIAISKLESTIISAMLMCDRVKTRNKLGDDADASATLLAKQVTLNGSTFGTLIKILDGHNIDKADISYLRWLKDKRDYFVHRLFHDGSWPGDLDPDNCRWMRRRLLAIQLLMQRGERRIWSIFERAGLVEIDDLGDEGMIIMNTDLYDTIKEDVSEMAASDEFPA